MTDAQTVTDSSQQDLAAVREAARDYIEGYLAGDAERHARAYHPECIKRRFVVDADTGVEHLQVLSPRIMADFAAAAGPMPIGDGGELIVDAISHGMASVRIYSSHWVDFLHLVKARGEWRLFHVTWQDRDRGTTTT